MASARSFPVGQRIQHRWYGAGVIEAEDDRYYHVRFDATVDQVRLIVRTFDGLEEAHGDGGSGPTGSHQVRASEMIPASHIAEEGAAIVRTLRSLTGRRWDGRNAITIMKSEGSRHWRQTEWIGFYFEWLGLARLESELRGRPGPTYGRVRFDYEGSHVWDLKTHPTNSGSSTCIVNDASAIRACLQDRGAFGVVILEGRAEYDTSGEFKVWHDRLKETRSAYVVANELRGARTRRRKAAFLPEDCFAVAFTGEADLDRAITDGWANDVFQAGMRNSDGSPRRAKVTIDSARVPSDRRIR